MKQIETRKSKDWITQVVSDIKELRLEVDIESNKNIKKSNLKMMVTTAIREQAQNIHFQAQFFYIRHNLSYPIF